MSFPYRPSMHMRTRSDFARAYSEGRRARGEHIQVVVRPNETSETRLGLSVGRTISKKAVERNRYRRVLREAFRLVHPELPEGIDVIAIPLRGAARPTLQVARSELVALARRALESGSRRRQRRPARPSAERSERENGEARS